jgi:hypothetical protein
MADDVIKQFVASLGFKVDKSQQADFVKSIDGVTASAVALGDAMFEMAKNIAQAMADVVPQLDKLYFQSQRLGSSATDIKAFGYAMSQLGGSAQGASQSLENLAEYFRSDPSKGAYLRAMGVLPQHLGNAAAMAKDLAHTFQNMPYWRAKQLAAPLGIDPATLRIMGSGQEDKYETQYKAFAERIGKAFGVSLEDAGAGANEFSEKLRELKAEFGLTFDLATAKILEKLLPSLEKLVETLTDWLSKGDNFNQMLEGGVIALTALAAAAVVANAQFVLLAASIALAVKASNDLRNSSIKHVAEDVNPTLVVRGQNVAATRHWVDDGGGIGHWEGRGSGDWNAKGVKPANFHGVPGSGWHVNSKYFNPSSIVPSDYKAGSDFVSPASRTASNVPSASGGGTSSGAGSSGSGSFGQAVAYFKSIGLSEAGARGLAATLYAESRLNPSARNKSGAYGIAQWLEKSRIRDIEAHFGHKIQGSGFTEQLAMVGYEIQSNPRFAGLLGQLKNSQSDVLSAYGGVMTYEAPSPGYETQRDLNAARGILGANPSRGSINQTNNVNINGAGDPAATARAVGGAINQANQALIGGFQRFAH